MAKSKTSGASNSAAKKKPSAKKSASSMGSKKTAGSGRGANAATAKKKTSKPTKKTASKKSAANMSGVKKGAGTVLASGGPKQAAKQTNGESQVKKTASLEIHIPNRDAIRIYSWNVNGIRANIKKGFFEWVQKESPDIFCLQETRATIEQLEADAKCRPVLDLKPYESHWHIAEKKGYSGVATFSSLPVLKAQSGFEKDDPRRNFNEEGRVIVTELEDFVLWNVYFPNGGRGPERVQYKMEFYDHCLNIWEQTRKAGRPIIICGDYNTAHQEIDLARPKENQTTSGFLPEEREFLDKIVSMGYVDVFRHFNNEPGQYTYWDQITRARERNVGWRIDYFFVSEETMPMVKNAYNRMDIMGSDHCPIALEIKKP